MIHVGFLSLPLSLSPTQSKRFILQNRKGQITFAAAPFTIKILNYYFEREVFFVEEGKTYHDFNDYYMKEGRQEKKLVPQHTSDDSYLIVR